MLHVYDWDPKILNRVVGSAEGSILPEPTVVQVGDFDGDLVAAVTLAVSHVITRGQPVLPLVINSDGGDPYALFAVLDLLDKCPVPVATIAVGSANSCGAVLLACGAPGHRYVSPRSTVMLHEVYQGSSSTEATRIEELKANADETSRLNTMLLETLDLAAKKRKGHFKKYLQGKADCYLTPVEAVKLGLVDHIGVPTLRTTVSVDMALELAGTDS